MSRAFKNNTIQADAGDNTNKIKIKTQYNYVKNAVANSCAQTNNFTIRAVSKNSKNVGILVCGSGMGMSMAANRHKKIRAAVCYSIKNRKLSRLHNNANIITLGSRLIKKNIAFKCIEVFLNTKFEGGRHKKRVRKI